MSCKVKGCNNDTEFDVDEWCKRSLWVQVIIDPMQVVLVQQSNWRVKDNIISACPVVHSLRKYYQHPSESTWCKTCCKMLHQSKYEEPIPVGEKYCPTCRSNIG